MKGDLVFFDIETSGLDPFRHAPIEFGYVIQREGQVINERAFSVPFDVELADAGALKVNGWGEREFAPQVTVGEAARMLGEDFYQSTMVVNSLQFDLMFTTVFLRNCGYKTGVTPWDHRGVDLKSVTAGVLGIAPHLLTTGAIQRHFDIPQHGEHTALGDAWFNYEWYHALGLWAG